MAAITAVMGSRVRPMVNPTASSSRRTLSPRAMKREPGGRLPSGRSFFVVATRQHPGPDGDDHGRGDVIGDGPDPAGQRPARGQPDQRIRPRRSRTPPRHGPRPPACRPDRSDGGGDREGVQPQRQHEGQQLQHRPGSHGRGHQKYLGRTDVVNRPRLQHQPTWAGASARRRPRPRRRAAPQSRRWPAKPRPWSRTRWPRCLPPRQSPASRWAARWRCAVPASAPMASSPPRITPPAR